jgi:hypothetical protein
MKNSAIFVSMIQQDASSKLNHLTFMDFCMHYLLFFLLGLAFLGFMSQTRAFEIYTGIVKTLVLIAIIAIGFAFCSMSGG